MKKNLLSWLAMGAAVIFGGCAGDASSYRVEGTISGLSASGLVLQNNGGDNLTVQISASSFQFSTPVGAGGSYDVAVASQPAGLTCSVSQGTGSNVQAAISNVMVSCSVRSYAVAGTISGLSASGLVLEDNGGDNLTVPMAAPSFQFPTPVAFGGNYDVTIASQPAGLTCTVTHGTGSNVQTAIGNVMVSCSVRTYTVAGTVSGLTTSGLVLQDNGGDNLVVPAGATTFQFPTAIAAGGGYSVAPSAQPAGLTCTVSNGTGSKVGADIDSIRVTCSPTTLTLGGTITGLTAGGLVLEDNGTDNLAIPTGATSFQFPTPIAYGSAYSITVSAQPSAQTCSVTHGASTATTDVANIAVTCTNIPTFTLTASSGANGALSPAGPMIVNRGANASFVATPDSGYGVYQWLLDGSVVQTGGDIYTLSDVLANHTVAVTFATATLTPSLSALALSVENPGLNAALTGNPREVIISNTGSIAATNVTTSASSPGLPPGAVLSSTCGSILAAGASCTLIITPGPSATSGCTNGTAAIPSVISVTADNASSSSFNVSVLGYGCIYQGGYVFAIDDTGPITAGISGKVAALTDQAPAFPNGVDWSPNGDLFDIPGIYQTSTSPCAGNVDGACDTAQIIAHYSAFPSSIYAAGLCLGTIGGYSDWYLPAICEMGFDGGGNSYSGCGSSSSPLIQNIQSNLVSTGVLSSLAGYYWSSTEYSASPAGEAYVQDFSLGGSSQSYPGKNNAPGVHCARAF